MSVKFLKRSGIDPGEGVRAGLMFSYIFLVIASLLIVKPVRTSLFLTEFGAEQLPYAFMLVALVSAVVARFYFKLASRFSLNRLISIWLLSSAVSLAVIWLLLHRGYQEGWFVYLFYIWVAVFGAISASQFWLLANYVFNSREAKRIFGFLGAGAIAGGIFGGYLTNLLVPFTGTNNLILICSGFILIIYSIFRIIWRKYARRNLQKSLSSRRRKSRGISTRDPVKLVLSSKHTTYMAGVIGIGVFVASLVDYQFSAIASEIVTDEDQLTAFFGYWYSNISVAALFVQFLLTRHILRRLGVGASLYFLPAGVLLGSALVLFAPSLGTVIIVKFFEGGFKQSINKAGLELLALPLPGEIKNRAKTFIDTFVPSIAEGSGGALLLLCTIILGISVQHISIVVLASLALWYVLLRRVNKEYVNSFRLAIEKRSVDLEELTLNVNDASVQQIFERVLEGANPKQIMYVLQLLEQVKSETISPYLEKLVTHPSDKVKAQVLKLAVEVSDLDFTEQARDYVPSNDADLRIAAIYYLCRKSSDPINKLMGFLKDEAIQVQAAAGIAAAHLFNDDAEIRKTFNVAQLWEETKRYQESMELSEVEDEFMRINRAEMFGIVQTDEFNPYLLELLEDESTKVLCAAIHAAGKNKAPEFVPVLIKRLGTKVVRSYARIALAEYGDEVIDELVKRIEDRFEEIEVRHSSIKVLAMIGSQQAAKNLFDCIDREETELRYAVLKAVNKIKDNLPTLKLNSRKINAQLKQEIEIHQDLLQILNLHRAEKEDFSDDSPSSSKQLEYHSAGGLLEKTIEERLARNMERIFRFLGLKYPQKDVYNAYLGVVSRDPVRHANAIEFLDNLLDFNLKQAIIPLLEPGTRRIFPHRLLLHDCHEHRVDDYLSYLVNGSDNWLAACSLFFIASSRDVKFYPLAEKQLTSPLLIVRETAEYAVKRLKSTE